jgi:AraC-like DNA-binding protein
MPPYLAAAVATVLEPPARRRLEALVQGVCEPLHVDSVPEAIRAVRERPVRAVLISPRAVDDRQLRAVESLVSGFPGVPTLAVVSGRPMATERLLQLGARGVSQLIDLDQRDGCRQLRGMLNEPSGVTAARILGVVIPALGEPTIESRRFFEILVEIAPSVASVKGLAMHLGVHPSTLMSRFLRVAVPSPKRYLAAVRLVYAAALLEAPGRSIADVAYQLQYSSPQSFGRHVRAALGMSASEFRRRTSFKDALDDFSSRLVVPFRTAFRSFHPLNHRGG